MRNARSENLRYAPAPALWIGFAARISPANDLRQLRALQAACHAFDGTSWQKTLNETITVADAEAVLAATATSKVSSQEGVVVAVVVAMALGMQLMW